MGPRWGDWQLLLLVKASCKTVYERSYPKADGNLRSENNDDAVGHPNTQLVERDDAARQKDITWKFKETAIKTNKLQNSSFTRGNQR